MRRTLGRSVPWLFGILGSLVFVAEPVAEVYTVEDLLTTRRVHEARISPDGEWIAYTVRRIRPADHKSGVDYRELYVVSTATGEVRPFVTGDVTVYEPRWSPDGAHIGFLCKRAGNRRKQVWVIALAGGEAHQVTNALGAIWSFRWHPGGSRIGYVATTPLSPRERTLHARGYKFLHFEEKLKHRNIYEVFVDASNDLATDQLTEDITVWTFEYAPNGENIAFGGSEANLVDHRYAFQHVYLLDTRNEKYSRLTDNPGKLGTFAFSPDGSKLAYVAAAEQWLHYPTNVYVIATSGVGAAIDVTPGDAAGHMNWVGWQDKNTVVYSEQDGVWNKLLTVSSNGKSRKTLLDSADAGIIVGAPSYATNFKKFCAVGSTAESPPNVYLWTQGNPLERMTTVNLWLADRELGETRTVRYPARDGTEIEGILTFPVGYKKGRTYPLVVFVHGGPESRRTGGWNNIYYRPIQVLAGRGYAVFLPNYRASTGYGIDFTRAHLGNAAGVEFQDVADGIDFLINEGIADRERVGLGGKSYGGYAAAWFATYYTDYVRAVCMFVGISDLVSKRGTTDIPYEELFVHSGKPLEEMWEFSLERSPIYYADQSKSAVLIYGGAIDPRVHPAQSMEFYRRLKMNDHPAVRLVQYPGEKHNNTRQPGKIDVAYRTLQWWDWYVRDLKPLDGPMPPVDISDEYGLDLE